MTKTQVMVEMKKAGTAQNRKIYAWHGASGEMFGVCFTKLREMKKRIKTNQALAEALWDSENVDARTLATLIADPGTFGKRELDRWLREVHYYMLADMYVKEIVSESSHARSRLEKWIDIDHEWVGRAGWVLLTNMAIDPSSDLSDQELGGYLDRIEREIHEERNLTRDAMNSSLIAIGIRSKALKKSAVAVARRIGLVVVDHGETGCKTPEAIAYMGRARDRKK